MEDGRQVPSRVVLRRCDDCGEKVKHLESAGSPCCRGISRSNYGPMAHKAPCGLECLAGRSKRHANETVHTAKGCVRCQSKEAPSPPVRRAISLQA